MNDEPDDLLYAVDALTKPQKQREQQDLLSGKVGDPHRKLIGQQTVTVEHAPLLDQLADAIAGAVGAGQSKGSLAFERNPIDIDALYKFSQIDETIRQWCHRVGIAWGKNPAANLRAWYVATLPLNLEQAKQEFYTATLNKWAGTINAKLDPWRERDLPDACPICGADTWWRDGIEYARPLVVRYKPLGADLIQHARGICRACETVWAVRELAWVLEQDAA